MKKLHKIMYLAMFLGLGFSLYQNNELKKEISHQENKIKNIVLSVMEFDLEIDKMLASSSKDSAPSDELINKTSRSVYLVQNNEQKSTGSGVAVEKDGQKYIITNDHVCDPYSTYTIYNPVTEVTILGKVFKADPKYDVCAIEIVSADGEIEPIKVAEFPKERFVHVWIMGYPIPHQLLRIDSGYRVYNQDNENFSGEVFSFCVDFGYSGSPIFNDRGEVITLINRKNASQTDVCESYGVYSEAFYKFYQGL